MAMMHGLPVVLSNAPPLQQDNTHASRMLQEHSGNRQQQNDYSHQHQHPHEQKYTTSLLTENVSHAYTGSQAYRPAHVYQQTPLRRNAYRYGQSRRPDPFASQLEDERQEKEARYLYHRFRSSDGYMKYRNRQHKDDKGAGQDQKWPDRLEFAFFKALVKWPPMGRRKLPYKDKQRGRNELIADSIEEWTGESRTRKQVSSHIQVLKPFVEGDPHIMRYLSKEDLGNRASHRYYTAGHSGYFPTGRRMSNHPVVAPPHTAHTPAPSMLTMEHHDLSQVKDRMEIFEPTDFSMFVQRKEGEDSVSRLHTYTKALARPRQPDRQAEDWATFAQQFPLLDAIHARSPLDCNILLAEASIAFPTDTWKKDKDKVELGISFLCSSRHLPAYAKVVCQNSFYRDGVYLKDYGSVDQVPMTQSEEDGGAVETQVKFGSAFWARTLAHLAGRLRENEDAGKDVDEYLKGITASQEIVLKTAEGHERLLVIYWKFRHSTAPCGRSYWSRLRLPQANNISGSATGYEAKPKTEHVDSVYNYTLQSFSVDGYQAAQPTTLQSPFEYDSSSTSTGSALNPATWPSNIDDSTNTAPPSAVDPFPPENNFDFSGGNINIAYDPNLDFSNFDSSALDFSATADFATDPTLQDYTTGDSQQDYSQQSYDWCDGFSTFDASQSQPPPQEQQQQSQRQQPPSTGASVSHSPVQYDANLSYHYVLPITSDAEPTPSDLTASQSWEHFNHTPAPYDPAHDAAAQYNHHGPEGHYDHAQTYQQQLGRQESQAYGGAGQEFVGGVSVKEESDPLAALAGVGAYMGPREGSEFRT